MLPVVTYVIPLYAVLFVFIYLFNYLLQIGEISVFLVGVCDEGCKWRQSICLQDILS